MRKGGKLELESSGVFELPVEIVPDDWKEQFRSGLVTFGAGADRDDRDCKFRVHEVPDACKTVSFAGRMQVRSLVVGDKLGSRAVGYLMIPKVVLQGE